MSDMINSPKHYTDTPFGMEVIEITQHYNFCLGNALKYVFRAGKKWDTLEDLKKAVWYLNREIKNREEGVYDGKDKSQQNENVETQCSGDQRVERQASLWENEQSKFSINAGDAIITLNNDVSECRYYYPQDATGATFSISKRY